MEFTERGMERPGFLVMVDLAEKPGITVVFCGEGGGGDLSFHSGLAKNIVALEQKSQLLENHSIPPPPSPCLVSGADLY